MAVNLLYMLPRVWESLPLTLVELCCAFGCERLKGGDGPIAPRCPGAPAFGGGPAQLPALAGYRFRLAPIEIWGVHYVHCRCALGPPYTILHLPTAHSTGECSALALQRCVL